MTNAPAVRYLIFGGASNVLLLSVFALFVWVGIAPELAAAVLYPVGIIVSYFGHKNYSFMSTELHEVTAPRYIVAHCLALAANVGAQVFFYRIAGLNPVAVQLVAAALVNVILYFMLRRVVFRGVGNSSG
jgi:putative flippase GtrA